MKNRKSIYSAYAMLALIFVVVTLILLFVNVCHGQAPKGANRIIVSTDSTKAANLNMVVHKLLESGYEPQEINKEYFTIKTAMKADSKASAEYYLYFICKDNSVIVSGQFKSTISVSMYGVTSENSLYTIENVGAKGSTYKKIFTKMDEFATSLGKIKYDIQ